MICWLVQACTSTQKFFVRILMSFLFPSLFHIAALQREGLRIYDASVDSYIPRSSPLVIFATADSLGGAAMSGMVGHSGKFGCRLYCNMPSRHCTGDGHYFPVMNQPHNYTVSGCCHPDIQDKDLGMYRVNCYDTDSFSLYDTMWLLTHTIRDSYIDSL